MPFNAKTTATRKALPKPEILATPLETNVLESCVLRAAAVSADSKGPYTGRSYLLAGTVLAKRDDSTYEPYTGGAEKEVQSITIDAKKGTWIATFEGEETGALAFNITKEKLQEALEELESIGEENVSVTGGPGDDGGTKPYVVTFEGELAEKDVPTIEVDGSKLEEGGASATVDTTSEGTETIAGILFETVEFADATSASNEPAAFLRRNVSFDKNKIVDFEELEEDVVEWGEKANVNCEFVDAKQTNV